jgi:hypothetical protein
VSLGGCSLPCRQSTVSSVGESSLVCLDVDNLGIASSISLVSGLVAEDLATIDKSSFGILAAIDEVGIIESELNRTVHDVVSCLNAKHEGMVLVSDFVSPASESSTRVDIHSLKFRKELRKNPLALKGWGWVAVILEPQNLGLVFSLIDMMGVALSSEGFTSKNRQRHKPLATGAKQEIMFQEIETYEATVIGRDDLVLRLDHLGVDKPLNAVLEEVVMVNRLHRRLGDFQHDRPVRAFLGLGRIGLAAIGKVLSWQLDRLIWLVVWRVVGENRRTVEGAVILREIELRVG